MAVTAMVSPTVTHPVGAVTVISVNCPRAWAEGKAKPQAKVKRSKNSQREGGLKRPG